MHPALESGNGCNYAVGTFNFAITKEAPAMSPIDYYYCSMYDGLRADGDGPLSRTVDLAAIEGHPSLPVVKNMLSIYQMA